MFFSWIKARRREAILREPFPPHWRTILANSVRHFSFLDDRQRSRLEGFVQVFVAEKDWVGGGGFALTEAMKITISGYGGVMTLGLSEPYYFDGLKTIIVYPQAYMPHFSSFERLPLPAPQSPRLGEAWHRGPVVLSWAEISQREWSRPGNNLVIHELAHHVDGLDGDVDGTPPLVGREKARTWYRVTEREFERLREAAIHRQATLLDRYGASNRAEFFAVASECFFERPHALRERHEDLYRVLSDFYCQNPAAWLPDAGDQTSEDIP